MENRVFFPTPLKNGKKRGNKRRTKRRIKRKCLPVLLRLPVVSVSGVEAEGREKASVFGKGKVTVFELFVGARFRVALLLEIPIPGKDSRIRSR